MKTEGYDGKEASADEDVVDEPSQWSISGSLLFSVTVITTIGRHTALFLFIGDFMMSNRKMYTWLGAKGPEYEL